MVNHGKPHNKPLLGMVCGIVFTLVHLIIAETHLDSETWWQSIVKEQPRGVVPPKACSSSRFEVIQSSHQRLHFWRGVHFLMWKEWEPPVLLIRGANFDHEYGETYLGEGPPNSPTEYIHAGLTPKLDLGPYFGRGGPFHSCPGKWAMAGKKMSVGLEMCRSQLPKKTEALSAPVMLGSSRIRMEKFGGFGMILGHPKFGPTYVLCLRDPFWGAISHHATFGALKTPSSCSGTWVCLKIGYPQCWWFSITFSIALQLMTSNGLSELSNNTLE